MKKRSKNSKKLSLGPVKINFEKIEKLCVLLENMGLFKKQNFRQAKKSKNSQKSIFRKN